MSKKDERLTVRCSVYDGDQLVEVVEQEIPIAQIKVALRRVHFRCRATSALEQCRRVVFESRKAKP